MMLPFNFQEWIDQNREQLKPPVSNKVLFHDTEFIIMVVGGPNQRNDYHINEGEEFFYQLEGEMTLKIKQDGKLQDIPIKAGEVFLLPPKVPHSPQRKAHSIGLVVERKRASHEQDGFEWYCPQCAQTLYSEFIHLTDIEKDLKPVFERYQADSKHQQCQSCGWASEC